MKNFHSYKTFIFDCDGVILNSNHLKAKCFYLSVLEFSEEIATDFATFHRNAGGISRSKKYDYFINNLLPKLNLEIQNKDSLKKQLIEKYEALLKKFIARAEVTPYLRQLKDKYNDIDWMIISGADQNELHEIFKKKDLLRYFNSGIFGSPANKFQIIDREIQNNRITYPALFFGDSKVDYFAAKEFKIDFAFLYEWTDLPNWETFCEANDINLFKNLGEILN